MRVGIIGTGKMGRIIKQVISESSHKIIAEFNSTVPLTRDAIKDCDVIIDFSNEIALEENLKISLELKIPFVTGTTGWYQRMDFFRDLVLNSRGSFFYASNFSIGVFLFHKLLKEAAKLYSSIPEYDFALHEVHHNQKSDTPSGTALTLADEILKNLDSKTGIQIGNPEKKIKNDMLHITSTRVGNVIGRHTLLIAGQWDSIEITHDAHNREGFASSALRTAEWLIGKKGFFTMGDMINPLISK